MATDGGPAFPNEGGLDSGLHPDPGMSLRDYFAAKAMQSIIAHTELVEDGKFLVGPEPGTCAIDNFAGFAYLMADAMLAARDAKEAANG